MKKRPPHVPIYNLGNKQCLPIHLRIIQDHPKRRLAFESPHRDDYYIFLFQQTGTTRLMVDFEEVILNGPCVYYLPPGQVHHFISATKTSGWLLALERQHINEMYHEALEEKAQRVPVVINMETQQQLQNCLQTLHHLLDYKLQDTFRFPILSQMVMVCTGLYTDIFSMETHADLYKESRSVSLTRKFRRLVKEHFKKEKKPSRYAGLLHVSPAYLNECVRTTTGHSVSYWIQQHIILEAKRLLGYSDLSIKEIASDFGYEDYPYFTRMFTKAVGSTPARFRKKYRV